MTPVEVVDIAREAIWVLLKVAAPVMLIALGVGLTVSLFQALTQMQEMTLAFVPKIIAIFVALIVLSPYMIGELTGFMDQIALRISDTAPNGG
ncbi:flagellar biosynthesis protein FliQ [Minwuia thermotolerans]|jgi:flagellar biosynthetic protein FliQ|uniref:Flagellar biosynthetic protein FliQ n=1 Tax=Minwuia thermotolerans TaxID=2056226 RepID=A0A2M9G6R3_9PROT|nr:flagellar biosynthesis protein FliQ [Minwuia thermotolerans]ANK81049.1 MAG: flagellar biosynthetic protein FliQ [Rhizobiales bacterium NRL2]PJK31408.1 flagellar biosynthetic protein FliQ [Minwuia thermotolerans]